VYGLPLVVMVLWVKSSLFWKMIPSIWDRLVWFILKECTCAVELLRKESNSSQSMQLQESLGKRKFQSVGGGQFAEALRAKSILHRLPREIHHRGTTADEEAPSFFFGFCLCSASLCSVRSLGNSFSSVADGILSEWRAITCTYVFNKATSLIPRSTPNMG